MRLPHPFAPLVKPSHAPGTPYKHPSIPSRTPTDHPSDAQSQTHDPARPIPSPGTLSSFIPPNSLFLSLLSLSVPTIQSATRLTSHAASPALRSLVARRSLHPAAAPAIPARRSSSSLTMPAHFAPSQPLQGGPSPSQLGPKELLIERALTRLRSIPNDLEKYTFLAGLRCRNPDVFYGLVGGNMKECCVSLFREFSFREWRTSGGGRKPGFSE